MGTPGATGTPGVEGKPGTMGVMGSTGEAGAPGPVGDAGPQGDAGAPGTAVIGIGDTYVKPNACQGVADGVAADVCYSTCEDSNDILLSGGCSWTSTPAGPNVASIPNLFPGAGAPPGGGQGWACSRNVTDANAASSVSVRALCLRVPGP